MLIRLANGWLQRVCVVGPSEGAFHHHREECELCVPGSFVLER